jgi:hypothetical protein
MAKKKKEEKQILVDDISRQIAEAKKMLATAQKSLAEKTAEISDIKARIKQLEKSADLPVDTESLTGKWYKIVDGTAVDIHCKNYMYILKDHGYKAYSDGTVYRKLTFFDLTMHLWECKTLEDNIGIYQEITELFEQGEINNLVPVKIDEIKKEVLRNYIDLFKILNSKNILPEEFKQFITQKRKKKNG